MRSLLENVVTNGGGRNAYVEGYRIGGKTGTAQIYVDGAISSDMHIGSFIGFAPMDDPQIAVLFIVDEATQRPDYGSTTAAPYAKEVLTQSLKYLGYAPEVSGRGNCHGVRAGCDGHDGCRCGAGAARSRFFLFAGWNGNACDGQLPAGGVGMAEHSLVMLYVTGEEETEENALVAVPTLRACPYRKQTACCSLTVSHGDQRKRRGGFAIARGK